MGYGIGQDNRFFECAICLKKYASKKILRYHVRKASHDISGEIPEFLKRFLPSTYKTNISCFKKIDENSFCSKLVLPEVSDSDSLHKWIDEFSKQNNSVYSRRNVCRRTNSRKMMLRETYFCYHYGPEKGTGRKKKLKGTNCGSKIAVALNSGTPNFASININFQHNHPLKCNKLRYTNHFTNVKEIFIKMFENGASTLDALKSYQIHVETQVNNGVTNLHTSDHNDEDYNWTRHLFQKTYVKKYNSKFTDITSSKSYIDSINEEFGSCVCCLKEINNEIVILISTPIMSRVFETHQINELYIESIGNVELFGLKAYLLLTQLENVILPLGVIISTCESDNVLVHGFLLYLNSADKPKPSPSLVILDDTEKLNFLSSISLNSTILQCPIHFLRSFLRSLIKLESNTNIRNLAYSQMKKLVFAEEENAFNNYYNALRNLNLRKRTFRYIDSILLHKEKWAFHCSKNFSHSLSICLDHNIRIIKDQITDRLKIQSIKSLLDYFVYDFSNHFIAICTELCKNKRTKKIESADCDYENYQITKLSEFAFNVLNKNKNMFYEINTYIGICTCATGSMGAYCKHQRIIANSYPINRQIINLESEKLQVLLYYVITSELDIPSNFFKSKDVTFYHKYQSSTDLIEVIEVNEEIYCSEHEIEDIEMINETEILQNDAGIEVDNQIKAFKLHISDICDHVQSHPSYFQKALINLNRNLEAIKKNPVSILKTMLSINSEDVADVPVFEITAKSDIYDH